MAAKKNYERLKSGHPSPTVTLTTYLLYLSHLKTGKTDSEGIRENGGKEIAETVEWRKKKLKNWKKNTNFITRIQLPAIKFKKNVNWPGAQYAPVRQQTHEKTPYILSGDLEKWTINTSHESSGSVWIQ